MVNIAADEVVQVTLGILNTAFPIICEPAEIKYAPRSIVDAQFSMPSGAAVALLCRRAYTGNRSSSRRAMMSRWISFGPSPTVRSLESRK